MSYQRPNRNSVARTRPNHPRARTFYEQALSLRRVGFSFDHAYRLIFGRKPRK